MKRKTILLCLTFSVLAIMALQVPVGNYPVYLEFQPLPRDMLMAGIGDNLEDFVDSTSDLHAPSDKGTHDVFADLQDYGSNYDAMTEADQGSGGSNTEDFVDQLSDLHTPSDIGTHTDWTELQDYDATYDTLQEEDTGGAGLSEYRFVDGLSGSPLWTTVGTTPYLSAQDQPTNYIYTSSNGLVSQWFTFADTSGSGSGFSVNCSVYQAAVTDSYINWALDWTGDGTPDASGSFSTTAGAWGWQTISATTLSSLDTATEINACRIRFTQNKGGGGPEQVNVDAARLGISQAGATNYDLDLELGWTNAPYTDTNVELCVFAGTQGAEALRVDIWDEAGTNDWVNLDTDITGSAWNNWSIAAYINSGTVEIRFTDTSGDAVAQDTWQLDGLLIHGWTDATVDYELDLEVGWTTADYDETNEYLCIYPVTGGGWPAEDILVDVWSGTWTNVIADLIPDTWNNVSVTSYLTGAAFEIRFLGGTEEGDSTQSTWEIDAVLLHVWTTSYAPVNDQAPTLDNPTETTKMFAQYIEYQITAYVSDQNGYADIDYLEISFWDDTQTTEYWRFRYDEDTNTFTEEYDSGTVVSLNTGSSSANEAGNDIDATFYFTIDWDHVDIAGDGDAKCYVIDTQSETDTDWYEVNWVVETRLDYETSPYVSADDAGTVDRGDLDETFYIDGDLEYYGSTTQVAPPTDQVDVWISASEYGTSVGPWSDTTLTAGAFQVTCYADDVVGQDTYTIKPVIEGAGSGGTSLYYTTDLTTTYIADQITVQTTTADDTRVDINANSEIRVTLWLEYDDSYLGSGDSVTLDDTAMTWDSGNSWFDLARSQASVGIWKYFVNSSSEATHGVTSIILNSQEVDVIWDRIIILTTTTQDGRIDINTAADLRVTAQLEYDSHALGSGDTLYMDDLQMSWNAGGWFEYGPSQASVGLWNYYVNSSSASEATYGITVVNLDGKNVDQIWDRIIILTTTTEDGRIDYNTQADIRVTAELEYDNHPLGSGDTLYMNGTSMSWVSSYFQLQPQFAQVGLWNFFVNSSSANEATYGITVVNLDGNNVNQIWDRIIILTTTADDTRVDINANSELRVTAELEYDNHPLGAGDTLYLDDTIMTWDGVNSWFDLSRSQASVGLWKYFVNSSSANEATYGITVVNLDSNEQDVIWDRILILTTITQDGRIDYNTQADIRVTAELEYDSHALGSGDTLYMNDTLMSWVSTYFQLQPQFAQVGLWNFFVNSSSANEATYGITVINLDGNNVNQIWDRIIILTTTVDDSRLDINGNAELRVTAELEYDSHGLGSGDTLYMDDVVMTWDGVNSWFDLTRSQASVGLWKYFVNSSSANEATYGITVINLDSNEQDVIWDRIIFDIQADDETPQNGIAVSFTVTVTYDYDDTSVATFQIQVQRNATNWYVVDQTNYTTLEDTNSDLTYLYNASSILSEPTYGLTAYVTNTETVIWSAAANNAPSNDTTPVLLNGDDTDYLYARYRFYIITTNCSDPDGYGEIDMVLLLLWDNGRSTNYWTVKYDEDLNSFSVVNGSTYISLAAYSYATRSGIYVNITWYIKIDWDHPDLLDLDVSQFVNDTADSDLDWYEVDWNTETRLDYTISPNVDDNLGTVDRGDLDGTFYTSGTVIFYGSGDNYPLANETDIWVSLSEYGSSSGPWNGDVDGSGKFNITCYADDVVGLDTATIKIVENGAGAGGTDLYYTTSLTDTYIADQIVVQTTTADDTRLDISTNSEVRVTLWLAYDSTYLGSGDSVTLDDTAMAWDGGNSWFELARSQASVGLWKYFVNSSYQTTHGISSFDVNSQDVDIIWDRIIILTTTSQDGRIDYGTQADIRVTAQLEYDSHALGSGDTLYMDDSLMSWVSTYFQYQPSKSQVGLWNYYVNSTGANEATYGITVVNLDGKNVDQIWDRIIILTTTTQDGRIDYNTQADLRVTAQLEYDSHALGSGDTLYMNGTSMSWAGSYFQLQPQFAQVGLWNFFVNSSSASEATYGITVVNLDGKNVDQIWDRIIILTTTTQDGRIDYDTQADLRVTAQLEYDGHALGSGDTLYMNGTSMSWVSSYFQLQPQFAQVGIWNFYVNSTGANEATYGISVVNLDSKNVDEIWDRIEILTTTSQDERIDYGTSADIRVTAQLEYDGHALGSGDTLYMDDSLMSWVSTYFQYQPSKSQVGMWEYWVNSTGANEATYGISVVYRGAIHTDQIWDRIIILTTTTQDGRIDYNTQADIRVTAQLEYDSHALGSGDTLYMNGTSMSWVSSYFQLQPQFAQVGLWNFFVNSSSANEATYGITVVNLDGNNVNQIWDRLIIYIEVDDATPENGHQANFTMTVTYDYDSTTCTTYTIQIDRNATNWYTFIYANVTLFNDTNTDQVYLYNATTTGDGVSESTYGLTVFTTNTVTVTWSLAPNETPVNVTAPVLINPDDTDHLYARYRFYIITTNVSDADGYANIQYVELSLYTDNRVTEIWKIRFTEDTNTFSVEVGSGIIVIASYSLYTKSGTTLDITWYIKIDWDHGEYVGIDTKQYVYDGSDSDTDWYESDWQTECRTSYSVAPYLSDDRGNINTADLQADGTVIYYGSALHPLANETDIWVIHDLSGSWSGNINGAGAFTITSISSHATVRLNTYTFKVVSQGAGAGGDDLHWATSLTDTFITDQIEFYSSAVDDGRINIGATGKTAWLIRYDYDNVIITSGLTAALNISKSLTYNGTHWIYSEVKGSAQLVGYAAESASETTYGITVFTQTAGNVGIVWDSLTISIADPPDQRVNIGANATGIIVTAVYVYDGGAYGGSFAMNDTTYDYSTVGIRGYKVASAVGNDAYGITAITTNDATYCIWDRVFVYAIDSNFTYVDYGEYIRVNITLIYDYDDDPITAGSFAINGESLTHIELGRWQMDIMNAGAFQKVLDELTTCSATLYGITVHTMNNLNVSIYWDKIEIYSSNAIDGRISINTYGYSRWAARLQYYTSVAITSGLIANVTGDIPMSYSGGYWIAGENVTTVSDKTHDVIAAEFDGISVYVQSASSVTIIWDRIRVLTTSGQPTEQEATKLVIFMVTLELEYDGTPVQSGTVTFDSRPMIWDSGNSRWQTIFTEQTAGTRLYFVNATTDGTYGVDALYLDGKSVTIIWAEAPDTGGHDRDRPEPPITIRIISPVWILVGVGGIIIGYIYLYGFALLGIKGLPEYERRALFKSIENQMKSIPKAMRGFGKSSWKALVDLESWLIKLRRKMERRLGS